MTSFGWFQPSALGMQGQSHALETISGNIANLNTTGYKRVDTGFRTLLSEPWAPAPASSEAPGPLSPQSDIAGIRAVDYARISQAGELMLTERPLDLAIDGRGFFSLSETTAGTGAAVFTRNGHFEVGSGPLTAVTDASGAILSVNEAYLQDGSGRYLLGWPVASATGGPAPAAGAPAAMRVDRYAFSDSGQATANAELSLNLPADAVPGKVHTYPLTLFDAASRPQTLDITFNKDTQPNSWNVLLAGRAGETVSVTPADAGATPGGGQALSFDSAGRVLAPLAYTIGVRYGDGGTADFRLDMRALTQYAGDFRIDDFSQDGYGQGMLQDIAVNGAGEVVGTFDNGRTRPLYRLALANFVNPDGLQGESGTVFTTGETSGPPLYAAAGSQGIGTVAAGRLERSNVDLGEQFARMILTQNAYNSSATAFRTIDEMTEVARDLKS